MTYEASVLGTVAVRREGAPCDLGGPKPRLVLALLLESLDRVVSTDALIDGLWGEDPPATAKKALQVHVSNLRKALGDDFPLQTAPGGYVLQSAGVAYDAAVFEEQMTAAVATLRTDPQRTVDQLTEALALWHGPAFGDIGVEEAIAAKAARLNDLRIQAVEQRIDAELRLGRHNEVLGDLETLTIDYPYREALRAHQMLALYRAGRQADALRAYQRTREVLLEDLGIEPGRELQALERQILEQSHDLTSPTSDEGESLAFLFTDLEDSTAMWEAEPELMQAALARHDEILGDAVTAEDGNVFKGTGDGVLAVFPTVDRAARAAVAAQQALTAEEWPTSRPLKVRMGVDEGSATKRGDDYFGAVLNRVARVMSSGHGQQVVVPAAAAARAGVATSPLGTADYKGVGRLEVHQLDIDGLPSSFDDLRTDRTPAVAVRQGFGRSIRGYELRERLGEGAHGIVYRAYQASVGREIAVKAIRPEFANQPGFVKRFEAEAQYVAQLEHPHIVSLYDYWRDPDGAYLAMQWLRGGSLAAALELATWKPPAALRLLEQVGSALDYAHRHGVVHRDLKPANVLLDDEGNGYLSDFSIASDHLAAGGPVQSTVAYLSPEELAGHPVDAAADMYGLGLLTYEIFTGARPALGDQPGPVGAHRPELPVAIDAVLAKATASDPTERYPRIDDFLRALRLAFGADVVTRNRSEPVDIRNPYKGLRAFTETDAEDFYGREAMVDLLVETVRDRRLTAVIGPSGSGKSSLVRAGLVPAARRGELGLSTDLLVTEMFPGSFPFEEMEAALLRVAVDRPAGLLTELESDDRGLLRVSKQILPSDDSELLLVIDQFEELFSLTTSEDVRRLFLDSLTTVARDDRSRVRVVVTMRADFFDRPLAYPEFGALMQAGIVAVTMPNDSELAIAIAQPARNVGLEFAAGVIPAMLRDVADQPGALPMLQYALTEAVREREGAVITEASYERTGGVIGALSTRAEEIYEGLSPSAKDVAREVFLRLVTVDDQADDTRRRIRRSSLDGLGLNESGLDAVLDEYGSFRLLAFDRDPVTRGPTVEVAHEALIREWPRYRGWIDSRREDLLLERRLDGAAAEWRDGEEDPSYLFRAGRLEQYERWAESSELPLTELERRFLDRSREIEDEDNLAQRRRRQRVLALVSLLAIAASTLAVAAVLQRNRANDQAAIAQSESERALEAAADADAQREDANEQRATADALRAEAEEQSVVSRGAALVANSAVAIESDAELAILLALEAHRISGEVESDVPGVHAALFEAVRADRLQSRLDTRPWASSVGDNGRLNADGSRLVTWPHTEDVEAITLEVGVYDTVSGDEVWREPVPDRAFWVEWDHVDDVVVVMTQEGAVERRDPETGAVLSVEQYAGGPVVGSYDNGRRALGTLKEVIPQPGGDLFTWTVEIERGTGPAAVVDDVGFFSVSPDTRLAAIWRFDDRLTVIDLETEEQLLVLEDQPPLRAARTAWVVGEDALWVASSDLTIDKVDVRTGEVGVGIEPSLDADILVLDSSPDGSTLAVGTGVGVVLVDIDNPTSRVRLETNTSMIQALHFAPDGSTIAATSQFGETFVWDLTATHGAAAVAGIATDIYPVYHGALSDGAHFLADSRGVGQVSLPGATAPITLEPTERTPTVKAAVGPDGRYVAVSSGRALRIYDAADGTDRVVDAGMDGATSFSSDGRLVFARSSARSNNLGWFDVSRVGVIDAEAGEVLWTLDHRFANDGAFLPDGSAVVVVGDRRDPTLPTIRQIVVLDALDGSEIARLTPPSACDIQVEPSPDGELLLVAGCLGPLWIYDLDDVVAGLDPEPLATTDLLSGVQITDLVWAADSQSLLVGSLQKAVPVFDRDLAPLMTLDVPAPLVSINLSDGLLWVPVPYDPSVGSTSRLAALPYEMEQLAEFALGQVTRSLTEAECTEYLGTDCAPV